MRRCLRSKDTTTGCLCTATKQARLLGSWSLTKETGLLRLLRLLRLTKSAKQPTARGSSLARGSAEKASRRRCWLLTE